MILRLRPSVALRVAVVTNRVGTDDNPVKECRECGAMLADDQAKMRHQNWHNELLKMLAQLRRQTQWGNQ